MVSIYYDIQRHWNNWIRALFVILIGTLVSPWVDIFLKQEAYVKQAYTFCNHDAKCIDIV